MNRPLLSAVLLCPTGQDAKLIAQVIKIDEISSTIVRTLDELLGLDLVDASMLVIAEESLTTDGIDRLNEMLMKQEPWSDIPIILLTSRDLKNGQFKIKRLAIFVSSGNVILLERPLQQVTLLSSAQVALRSRTRQFQVRKLLLEQITATKIRDEFISIASHELKTPLTSLKLQTQMAKKQAAKANALPMDKMVKQLDYTIKQIDRLNTLVDDMLDLSRINSGKLQLQKAETDLSELLAELVDRFMPQFEALGCTVSLSIQPAVVGVWDNYKLEQVINNIFSNALRYSPRKTITVSLVTRDRKAELIVADQGPGIAPENLERIFGRFERASAVASGLGLGLYITRQIIDLHDGSIHAESKPGEGAKFIIELPLTM